MDSTIKAYRNKINELLALLEKTKAERDALQQVQKGQNESIAVVGMACRFPAGGTSPEAFWQALEKGVDGVRRIPTERWPPEAVLGNRPGSRWASLLDVVDEFDAAFFGISSREAVHLDPQQRLLLEVAWEALENAGERPDQLNGTSTGVFLGMCTVDYQRVVDRDESYDVYSVIGNMFSTAAGRISYVLGLQGPCLTVDTACSSSLTAIHLAVQSLRHGESKLALAGGVKLMLAPQYMSGAVALEALSPDGRCKTFDADASGFVLGEGCGMVALKRLSDAERDGNPILALIRGTAMNQDGRSTALTAPNVLSQQAMLHRALENAQVKPEDIGYVETHGTATSLGDPIELEALKAVLGQPREDGTHCVLGALKTNIGHLEAAAGVAGFIKAVLCLQHEAIPKNIHFKTLNPRVSLAGTSLMVPAEMQQWPRGSKTRFAGVSSFGFSGTNAHVILEEAPNTNAIERPPPAASAYLLPLSAKTLEGLSALAREYSQLFSKSPSLRLDDIAYTASVRRGHHDQRLAIAGRSTEEMVGLLAAFLRGDTPARMRSGRSAEIRSKLVFVFPGQGSQWLGMGRKLLTEEPIFRACVEECNVAVQRETGFSVLEELTADESHSRLREIDIVQPVLFTMEVALAALWQSWGVTPDAVVGHSMGEVAAAYVAGALTLYDAVKIVCHRSRLLRSLSGQGEMALVELTMTEAHARLEGLEDKLSIAVSNGPRSTVIAGDPAALQMVLDTLEKENIFCRKVKVDVASHSPAVDPLREDLLAALKAIAPRTATLCMPSTVTGNALRGPELTASYWFDNLRNPVLFSTTTQGLIQQGHTIFVEISPHPILLSAVDENLREMRQNGLTIASLRRQADERQSLLESLGALYMDGFSVDWKRLYPTTGQVVSLPNYPWQRQRYWVEAHTHENRPSIPLVSKTDDKPTGATNSAPQAQPEMMNQNQGQRPTSVAEALPTLKKLLALAAPPGAIIDDDVDIFTLGLESLALLSFYRSAEANFGIPISLAQLSADVLKSGGHRAKLPLREFAAWILADSFASSSAEPREVVDIGILPEADGPHPYDIEVFDVPRVFSKMWRFHSGLELEVAEVGEGPPLVVLPPIGCEIAVWKPFIRVISKNRRVIAINYPGYGRSPFFPELTSVENLAAATHAILEITDPNQPADIVGWSLGGFIAQNLAARAPSRVRTMTLVNTTSYLDVGNSAAQIENLVQRLTDDLNRDLARSTNALAAECERLVYRGSKNRGALIWSKYLTLVASFDFRQRAITIRTPTLIVAGADDIATPWELSTRMHQAIEGSKLVVLPGVGHYVPVFRPDDFAAHVQHHIAD